MRQKNTGKLKCFLPIAGFCNIRMSSITIPVWLTIILLNGWVHFASAAPQFLAVEDRAIPAGPDSKQAHLSASDDGRLLLSWVEPEQKAGKTLKFSLYDGKTWSEPKTVISLPDIYDLPKVIALNDGAFGAVWGTETKGKKDSSNEVYLSRSADGGLTWSKPVQANSDRTVKTARYNAHIAPLPDGKMAAFWSDARNHNKPNGTQYLMGTVMNTDGSVEADFAVDDDICSCCQLLPTRYKDKLYVTYRDRLPGDVRDIAVVPWPGIKAAQPVRVHKDNWVLPGCPGQNVGSSASAKRLGVAWFTAVGGKGKVQAAFAENPETGFGEPVNLDPKHKPQGEVKMVMLDDNRAAVHWIRKTQKGPELQLAVVSTDGKLLAESSLNKPDWKSKFEWPNLPAFTKAGDKTYFSWLDTQTGRIRLVKIDI